MCVTPRTCRDGLSVTAVVGGPTSCEQTDLVAHEDAGQGALGCLQLAGIHLDADHGSALLLAAAERLFAEGAEPEVGGRTTPLAGCDSGSEPRQHRSQHACAVLPAATTELTGRTMVLQGRRGGVARAGYHDVLRIDAADVL